jgi:hypothetical protein
MKKIHHSRFGGICAIAAALLLPTLLFSQDLLWEKSYGGRQAEYLGDVQPTADYGFILAGSSLSGKTGNKMGVNNGDLDYWVWKMDETGQLDWQKNFGGSGTDLLQSIRLTNDGGFILAGNSNSPPGKLKKEGCRGGDDYWVIKLDAKGNEEWQKTIGGSGQEKLQSICPTRDGGYILGGSSSSQKSGEKTLNGFGNLDYWVVKLDHDGKIQWQQVFGGVYVDELRSIEQTFDSGYILGGYSNSSATGNKSEKNNGVGDYWVIKLDLKGEIQWQHTLGGNMDDQLYVVHQTSDGGYMLGGNSNSGPTNTKLKSNSNGTDFWVVKLNADGDNVWQETYDIGKVDVLTSLVENKDHTILLGGFAKTEIANTNKKKDEKEINDYVAIKISEKGDELWRKSIGSDGEDVLKKVSETRDGGYILAGTSNPAKTGSSRDSNSKSKNGSAIGFGNGANKQLENATSAVNDKMKEYTQEAKDAIDEETGKATKKINDAIGPDKDSRLQYGLNTPNNPLGNAPSLGSGGSGDALGGLLPGADQAPSLPGSRDKAKSYGTTDFWVVKLGDRDKPTKVKAGIEAMPNPARDYTNVIIGYDYASGTATLVDLAGHTLDSFALNGDRTVPVNLSRYPDGIYIVNVKTEKGSEGVKIIKGGN